MMIKMHRFGFSLIELMIVLTISSMLMIEIKQLFKSLWAHYQVQSSAILFRTYIKSARELALRTRQYIILQQQCARQKNLQKNSGPCHQYRLQIRSLKDLTLWRQHPIANNLKIQWHFKDKMIIFSPKGFTKNKIYNGSLHICHPLGVGLKLVINRLGRMREAKAKCD